MEFSLEWLIEHVITNGIGLIVTAIVDHVGAFLGGILEFLQNPPHYGA